MNSGADIWKHCWAVYWKWRNILWIEATARQRVPNQYCWAGLAHTAVGEQAELAQNWTEPKYQRIAIWRIQAFNNVAIRFS